MWEHRNSIKHSDLSLQAQERIRQVDDAINDQFELGTADLPQKIHPFLSEEGRNILSKSLAEKEDWLKFICGERRNQRRALRHQRKILRDFFQRPGTPS